jgi:hypothetical protein
MNGRVYDPLLAMFLSPDPFIQSPSNVQNYNRYTYCFNNPFKYIDPSGFSAYEDYMNSHYGEGNYWYRGQAPGTWGSSSGSFGGDFSTGTGGGYFGAPGQGLNGTGLDGVYYDWYSGTYRSTGFGYNQITWGSANRILSEYAIQVSAIIYAGTQSNPFEVFRGLHFDDGSTWYVGEGFTPSSNPALGQGSYETISFSELAPEQDFRGFWGGVKYFWTGGNIDGYHYNINGKATGFAPIMGMPRSFIGGPLRKGEQAVKLGKYLFNPSAFHAVKKGVLSFANPKNFAHIVGRNPNLMFKGGKIWLTGTKTGGYFGKTYETGMTIADFLKLF